jgi:hypothetical protein
MQNQNPSRSGNGAGAMLADFRRGMVDCIGNVLADLGNPLFSSVEDERFQVFVRTKFAKFGAR